MYIQELLNLDKLEEKINNGELFKALTEREWGHFLKYQKIARDPRQTSETRQNAYEALTRIEQGKNVSKELHATIARGTRHFEEEPEYTRLPNWRIQEAKNNAVEEMRGSSAYKKATAPERRKMNDDLDSRFNVFGSPDKILVQDKAPAQTAPAQTAPAQTAPAQTAPAQTAPANPVNPLEIAATTAPKVKKTPQRRFINNKDFIKKPKFEEDAELTARIKEQAKQLEQDPGRLDRNRGIYFPKPKKQQQVSEAAISNWKRVNPKKIQEAKAIKDKELAVVANDKILKRPLQPRQEQPQQPMQAQQSVPQESQQEVLPNERAGTMSTQDFNSSLAKFLKLHQNGKKSAALDILKTIPTRMYTRENNMAGYNPEYYAYGVTPHDWAERDGYEKNAIHNFHQQKRSQIA